MDREDVLLRAKEAVRRGLPVEGELRRSLDAVFAEVRPRLMKVTARHVRNPALVEELVQDTLLSAWTRLDCYPEGSDFRRWVSAIALLVARNRPRRVALAADRTGATAVADPLQMLLAKEQVELLLSALTDLPEPAREALHEHYALRLEPSPVDRPETRRRTVQIAKQQLRERIEERSRGLDEQAASAPGPDFTLIEADGPPGEAPAPISPVPPRPSMPPLVAARTEHPPRRLGWAAARAVVALGLAVVVAVCLAVVFVHSVAAGDRTSISPAPSAGRASDPLAPRR